VLRSPDGPLDDTAPARRAITVRDLLTYTAGFGMSWSAWTTPTPVVTAAEQRALGAFGPPHPQAPPPPDVWLRRFAELPLMVQPGERWQYHTSGELLGVVLARAATRPLDDVLRERILEPLGMRDTGFHVPAASLPRFATSYQVSPAGSLELYDDVGGDWAAPPAFPSGGGGLVSTLDDLLAFARMLVAGGRHAGTRVLPAALVADMTRDQLAPAQKLDGSLAPGFFAAHGWGYGVCVHTARDDAGWPAGTYGWDGGLGTSWRTDPATGTIAVLLTQAMAYPDTWPVYRQFWASAAPAPA
jgi:CubicO group peptidase (beta-lactamase class C family)